MMMISCTTRRHWVVASSRRVGRHHARVTPPPYDSHGLVLVVPYSPPYRHHILVARCLSSNSANSSLLGHSPMAPHIPNTTTSSTSTSTIPKALDASGGVWAPTSAKREKLKELQGELLENNKKSLDDMATMEERLDLYLVDGVAAIVKSVEEEGRRKNNGDAVQPTTTTATSSSSSSSTVSLLASLQETLRSIAKEEEEKVITTQTQWESTLQALEKQVDGKLASLPPDRCLKDIRDYLYYDDNDNDNGEDGNSTTTTTDTTTTTTTTTSTSSLEAPPPSLPSLPSSHVDDAILRFCYLQTKYMLQVLRTSYKTLTTVSDQDVDRAAVMAAATTSNTTTTNKQKDSVHPTMTLSISALCAVLEAVLLEKSDATKTHALWNLLDRDQDGLLDESEMNQVCLLVIESTRLAVQQLFREALEAHPVRAPWMLAATVGEEESSLSSSSSTILPATLPMGWRARRKNAKAKKQLLKQFEATLQAHFVDEVELPHRMRCIYAWANKQHQDNKIDSVLVDDDGAGGGWSGRKRYVELHPKISYSEFKEVQQEHLQHLDNIGSEFIKGFREVLWVKQGRHRQRRQLYRDCTLFLMGVTILDVVILSL